MGKIVGVISRTVEGVTWDPKTRSFPTTPGHRVLQEIRPNQFKLPRKSASFVSLYMGSWYYAPILADQTKAKVVHCTFSIKGVMIIMPKES